MERKGEGFWIAGDNQFHNVGTGHTGLHLRFRYFFSCGLQLGYTTGMTKRKSKVARQKNVVVKVFKITMDNSVYVSAPFSPKDNTVLNSTFKL